MVNYGETKVLDKPDIIAQIQNYKPIYLPDDKVPYARIPDIENKQLWICEYNKPWEMYEVSGWDDGNIAGTAIVRPIYETHDKERHVQYFEYGAVFPFTELPDTQFIFIYSQFKYRFYYKIHICRSQINKRNYYLAEEVCNSLRDTFPNDVLITSKTRSSINSVSFDVKNYEGYDFTVDVMTPWNIFYRNLLYMHNGYGSIEERTDYLMAPSNYVEIVVTSNTHHVSGKTELDILTYDYNTFTDFDMYMGGFVDGQRKKLREMETEYEDKEMEKYYRRACMMHGIKYPFNGAPRSIHGKDIDLFFNEVIMHHRYNSNDNMLVADPKWMDIMMNTPAIRFMKPDRTMADILASCIVDKFHEAGIYGKICHSVNAFEYFHSGNPKTQ